MKSKNFLSISLVQVFKGIGIVGVRPPQLEWGCPQAIRSLVFQIKNLVKNIPSISGNRSTKVIHFAKNASMIRVLIFQLNVNQFFHSLSEIWVISPDIRFSLICWISAVNLSKIWLTACWAFPECHLYLLEFSL